MYDKEYIVVALSCGVRLDMRLDRKWSINLDVKKAYIRSDVYAAGSSIGRLKVDPVLYAVGLGYRF